MLYDRDSWLPVILAELQERKMGKITRAISIKQPYVELILRGKKNFEYRSRPTNIRERVFLYASLKPAEDDEAWRQARASPGSLPTGCFVGSVDIAECEPCEYAYKLLRPERLRRSRKVKNQPLPRFWKPRFR